jgi:hypothetical protein
VSSPTPPTAALVEQNCLREPSAREGGAQEECCPSGKRLQLSLASERARSPSNDSRMGGVRYHLPIGFVIPMDRRGVPVGDFSLFADFPLSNPLVRPPPISYVGTAPSTERD